MTDTKYGPKSQFKALKWHQEQVFLHPLTCGNEDCRGKLEPVLLGKTVILECPDCDYMQYSGWEHVVDYYFKTLAFGAATFAVPVGQYGRDTMGQ